MSLTPQQIADEQLRICVEWIAHNLQTSAQKPTRIQIENFKKACRMNLDEPLIDLS